MNSTGIVRITQQYLDAVNDPYPGESTTGLSNPNAFLGQVGAYLILNEGDAIKFSSATGIGLHAGVYQYVQFVSTSTASNVAGGPVFWVTPAASGSTTASYVVTPDVPSGYVGFAGASLNAVTKGNYGFILVEGFLNAAALGTITKGTPAAGDVMFLTATAGGFDDPTTASLTTVTFAQVAGQWLVAPATGTANTLGYIRGQKMAAVA